MKKLLVTVLTIMFPALLTFNVIAAEENRHSGVDTSAENKSEQGLEQGNAYAGTNEKRSNDATDDSDENDKSGKKEKKEKKEKSEKEGKQDKELKDKKDKKEK